MRPNSQEFLKISQILHLRLRPVIRKNCYLFISYQIDSDTLSNKISKNGATPTYELMNIPLQDNQENTPDIESLQTPKTSSPVI